MLHRYNAECVLPSQPDNSWMHSSDFLNLSKDRNSIEYFSDFNGSSLC
jgi:hypothetical protein